MNPAGHGSIPLAGPMHAPRACAPGPRRVVPPLIGMDLLGLAARRAVEARSLAAEPGGALMRRAAGSVARWVAALAPHAARIWIACGPGGNGGDGLHAAACLARQGRQMRVSLHADAARLPPDTAAGLRAALAAGVRVTEHPESAGSADLAIDALLGLGACRPPEGPVLEGIRALREAGIPVLAVDLPTGLHPDSGALLGSLAVQAQATLALLRMGPGLFTGMGRELAGEIWFDDLDIAPQPQEHPVARLIGRPPQCGRGMTHSAHKGTYGDTAVIGGAAGMAGALTLAAQAALAAGSGRTVVVALDPGMPLRMDSRPELLWRGSAALEAPQAWWQAATVVCGCGGGESVATHMPTLLEHSARIVLDADALNALAADPVLRAALAARAARGAASVLTPHPLEAARLLGCSTVEVQSDRLAAASELAGQLQATVVLKGSGTVVCTPNEVPGLNGTGGPALATGGTGDVLAGWIGGRWSRQRSAHADARAGAHAAALASVWLHGRAADGRAHPLRALELVELMRCVEEDLELAG
jgi:hydroxyethylthiazole kinase-like uncharacterized protein yjeF